MKIDTIQHKCRAIIHAKAFQSFKNFDFLSKPTFLSIETSRVESQRNKTEKKVLLCQQNHLLKYRYQKYFVTTAKCLVLLTKRLFAAAKFLVAATKILFAVPNFAAVTKPFFTVKEHQRIIVHSSQVRAACLYSRINKLRPGISTF